MLTSCTHDSKRIMKGSPDEDTMKMTTSAKWSEYRCRDKELDNKRKMVVMLSRVTLVLHLVIVLSIVVEYLGLSTERCPSLKCAYLPNCEWWCSSVLVLSCGGVQKAWLFRFTIDRPIRFFLLLILTARMIRWRWRIKEYNMISILRFISRSHWLVGYSVVKSWFDSPNFEWSCIN